MVYAAVANCPVFGGKLKSLRFSAITGRRGIIAVVPVRMASRWSPTISGAPRKRSPRCRSYGTSARRRRPTARGSPPIIAPRSTARSPTAAAMATSPRRVREAGEDRRGGLRGAVSRACADGAAERDRALAPRSHRRLDGHAISGVRDQARGQGGRRRSARRSSSTIAFSAAGSAGARSTTNCARRWRSPRRSSGRSS